MNTPQEILGRLLSEIKHLENLAVYAEADPLNPATLEFEAAIRKADEIRALSVAKAVEKREKRNNSSKFRKDLAKARQALVLFKEKFPSVETPITS